MTRCSLCPRFRPPVPSVGPVPARVLLIGEGPSYREDSEKQPFVGPTGQELNQTYLTIANLPRSEVHITNARCCSEKHYENPTPEQALSCSSTHLGPLLERVKPQIIVPMGAIACSLWPEINLNLDHGIPHPGKWGAFKFILYPSFHPSAGLHSTGYMIPLMQDFDNLRKLLLMLDQGTFFFPEDLWPNPDYRICRTRNDVSGYFKDYYAGGPLEETDLILAEDTESIPGGIPYCLTYSHTPGTGRLIYVRDRDLIDEYKMNVISSLGPHQLFHNYLHDVEVFDALNLPIGKFTDTMVRAYNLCLGGGADEEDGESRAGRGSLSLKVLAYRHLNVRMTSFKDTVYPHSIPKVLDWLWQAESIFKKDDRKICVCGHANLYHTSRLSKTGKTVLGSCTICTADTCKRHKYAKPLLSPQSKLLNRLHLKITNLILSLENKEDVDPWKRIRDWNGWDRETVEEVLGPAPRPSIEYVPEDELLRYAVRDADATLRLYLFLKNLKPWVFY